MKPDILYHFFATILLCLISYRFLGIKWWLVSVVVFQVGREVYNFLDYGGIDIFDWISNAAGIAAFLTIKKYENMVFTKKNAVLTLAMLFACTLFGQGFPTTAIGSIPANSYIFVQTPTATTGVLVSDLSANFANTNLTLTAARTHNGGTFALQFDNFSSFTFNTQTGAQSFFVNNSTTQFRTDNFRIRGSVGASHAQPVILLYEDPDNASADNYVGLRSPATSGSDRIWTLPNADATSQSFWVFDGSEVGTLATFSTTANNPGPETGSSILFGNSTAISGRTTMQYDPNVKRLVVNFANAAGDDGKTSFPLKIASYPNGAGAPALGTGTGILFGSYRFATGDSLTLGAMKWKFTDTGAGVEDASLTLSLLFNGTLTDRFTLTSTGNLSVASLNLDKTVTATGTTGGQTINKATGTVNFAAAATSLVVTNSLITANSIVVATVMTNDATMHTCQAVVASGSFTLYPNAAPTGETKVSFVVLN